MVACSLEFNYFFFETYVSSLRQVWEVWQILQQLTNLQMDKRNISELYVVNDNNSQTEK